mgnify:CR=1 FL=1
MNDLNKINLTKTNSNKHSSKIKLIFEGFLLINFYELILMLSLFLFTLVIALIESSVIALVIPLVQTIIDPNSLNKIGIFSEIAMKFQFQWTSELFPVLALILITLIFFSGFFKLLIDYLSNVHAEKCQNRLGDILITKIIEAPYLWINSKKPTEMTRQLYADIRAWRFDFLQSSMRFLQSLVLIILPSLIAFVLAPFESIAVLILISLLSCLLLILTQKKIHNIMNETKNIANLTLLILLQIFTGIKELKIHNSSNYFINKFNVRFSKGNKLVTLRKFLVQLSPLLILTFGQIGFVITAIVLWKMEKTGAEITSLLAMLGVVVSRVLPALNSCASSFNSFIASLPFVESIVNTHNQIQSYEKIRCKRSFIKFNKSWRMLEFKNVTFKYNKKEDKAVRSISFKIKRGEKIGIVGQSGSGKSTIINLIAGIFEPINGNIFIDDQKLSDLDIKVWRDQIGYVSQNIFFLNDTILANILFGKKYTSDDKKHMEDVIKSSHLENVIKKLPEKLMTNVGEGGDQLSGGQSQRIGIARALYKKPKLLILDEATSSLDKLTETKIQQTIKKLGKDILVISIAHRISSLKAFDKILVIDNGRIKDIGTYDELLKKSRHFNSLVLK